jgi:hypothetical protein
MPTFALCICWITTLTLGAGVFFTAVMGGAFAFGISFNAGTNAFWDNWNKGVRIVLFSTSFIRIYEAFRLRFVSAETMERHSTQVH